MTRRPFLQTTFPVAASINIREGTLETLYLFHSFSCKRDGTGEKKGELGSAKRKILGH